jgi:signal transduction histidine kinase
LIAIHFYYNIFRIRMNKKEKKILVVDDNIDFVSYVRKVLEREEYQLSIALAGKTALGKTIHERPNLILLDLKLPDMSGEEVLEKVREVDPGIAVVVITGYGDDQVAIDLMRKGAIDFLTKPVEHTVLIKAIQNAFEIQEAQLEERKSESYPSFEKFFPFLAHEIRNPLHAIAGALAIIKRRSNPDDPSLSQSIKIIHEEVQHLNDFVQECLNFIRPPDALRFNEVNLSEIIDAAQNMLSHMYELESKKMAFTVEIEHDLPTVYVNYEEIKQAFINIMKNGVEAMPEGGALDIKARRSPAYSQMVEILFQDQGVGMKREVIQCLFNPFFTTKPRGNGLGLAICRRIIVERHGGKIDIQSEENKGTTVKVVLPIDGLSKQISGEVE